MKEECKEKYTINENECAECQYHLKCKIEQSAWNDVLYAD